MNNAEVLEEMRRLRQLYALKRTMRYETTRDHTIHSESVAEHLFGMMVLAQYFLPIEDPKGRLDRQRVYELILYHEIGEIETGDILFNKKTEDHREAERQAAVHVVSQFPKGVSEEALSAFREFDEEQTPEARFVIALDKLEPIFELLDDVNMKSYKRLGIKAVVNIEPKLKATDLYPHMRACLDAGMQYFISQDAFAE